MNKGNSSLHYLERYQEGQYREVWHELVQLGPTIFENQLYTEALAVARAMMQRVRVNIETLIARLLQRGFVFGYDIRLQEPLTNSLTSAHNRRQYLEMRAWAHTQSPVFLPAKQQAEEIALTQRFFEQDPSFAAFYGKEKLEEEKIQLQQAIPYIDALEQMLGPVPLAVRAWFEEIEAVNFFGYHPQWSELVSSLLRRKYPVLQNVSGLGLMSYCDPFQIHIPDEQKMLALKEEYRASKSCTFEFAPDHDFKDYYGGTSTPYSFVLPQAGADAVMPNPFGSGSTTFVEYIHTSLAWAGFPGMVKWLEVPRDDLDFLTHDLLPF